jgi:flagellar motility protein MotE (MotC chaperone)
MLNFFKIIILKTSFGFLAFIFVLTIISIPSSKAQDKGSNNTNTPISKETPKLTETPTTTQTPTITESPSPSDTDLEILSADMKYLEEKKLKALKEKEAALEKRTLSLDEKEKQLKELQNDLEKQRKEIITIQEDIKKMMDAISVENLKKIGQLAKIFESMKAENAAIVLVELYKNDQETAIQVLKILQPRKSGKIMDAVARSDKEIAAKISSEISKKQTIKK